MADSVDPGLTGFIEALGMPALVVARARDGGWQRALLNARGRLLEAAIGPLCLDPATLAAVERCAATGEPADDERTATRDGRPMVLRRCFATLRHPADPEAMVLVTLTDVSGPAARSSAISESEQRFRDFTEAASDSFWETDVRHRMVWMRGRAGDRTVLPIARQFGMTVDEVLEQSGSVPESDRPVTEIMAAREPLENYVYRLDRPDGPTWRVIDGRPFHDREGRFCGYRGVTRDITENRRQMAAMEEARRQAEQADRAKSRFLAAATHDLRQPLQAAIMFHAVLQRLDLPDAGRDGLDKLGRSLTALQDMLTRLLDISRLDAGVIKPDRHAFPVGPLIERLADAYGPIAAARGVALRHVACSATVISDPHLLDRILENLVSNAVKYTQRGRVLIGCRRVGDALAIRVYDTGPGIAEEDKALIFEEFRRGGNAPGDIAEGLGIGLSIVERLARLLGHDLTLASESGRGTLVEVRVPLLEAALKGAAAPPMGVAPGPARAITVLVVDDDAAVRESLALALESSGYRVLVAATGEAALAEGAEAGAGLSAIVADLGLGNGPDGISVIQGLRQRLDRDVPALLLTGDTTPDRLRDIARTDIDVVHKPVLPDVLGAQLKRLTES
ncbi:MAG: response regulator [Alphaproteobacteria bacterium]|jgi:two-component system CheB/CheR fusion protein|nr:response regulator [Alphaproteobacteria bacterium]